MDAASLNVLVMIATVATAIFTGWAVWQRWRYTPRPHWLEPVLTMTQNPGARGNSGAVEYHIANRGDATAMDVRVYTESGEGWDERHNAPLIDPGDDVKFWLGVPATYPGRWDSRTDKYEAPLIWTWRDPRVRITWRQHPRLTKVKSKTFSLPRPTDRP